MRWGPVLAGVVVVGGIAAVAAVATGQFDSAESMGWNETSLDAWGKHNNIVIIVPVNPGDIGTKDDGRGDEFIVTDPSNRLINVPQAVYGYGAIGASNLQLYWTPGTKTLRTLQLGQDSHVTIGPIDSQATAMFKSYIEEP